MTTNTMTTDQTPMTATPPGPGVWEADLDHQDRPRGRLFFELFSDSFRAGFADMFRRYGLPLEELRSAGVNGWHYTSAKAVGAPEGSGAPPPDFVLKVVSRLHPELRRRNRAATAALADKLWVRDADGWLRERGDWHRRIDELGAIDLASLDDTELSATVEHAMQLSRDLMRRHFELQGPAVAAGRLLAAGDEWGVEPTAIHALFVGASPHSAETVPALVAMRERLIEREVDPDAVADYDDLVAHLPAEVGEFMSSFGRRILDDDIGGVTLDDRPDRLVDLVRSVADRVDNDARYETARADVRRRVPLADHERFDELVDDVRRSYWCLDDHSALTARCSAAAQRVLREVEGRAIANGVLAERGDIELLGVDEVLALLGSTPIGAAELRARREALAAGGAEPPAPVLGGEVHPPPSAEVFPAAMAEMTRSIGAYLSQKLSGGEETSRASGRLVVDGEPVASGHAIGGEVTAPVVVARTAAEALDLLEPGAILVCPFTSPAWNVVFPMLGGIVTEVGEPLGHTAVMAREFGLPALVGVGDADPAWHGRTATIRPG